MLTFPAAVYAMPFRLNVTAPLLTATAAWDVVVEKTTVYELAAPRSKFAALEAVGVTPAIQFALRSANPSAVSPN
jgi:hypothetical protein